jgi:hypothetical protein
MLAQLVVERMFDPEATRRFVAGHQVPLAVSAAGSPMGSALK